MTGTGRSCGEYVVARGLSATQVKARADALAAHSGGRGRRKIVRYQCSDVAPEVVASGAPRWTVPERPRTPRKPPPFYHDRRRSLSPVKITRASAPASRWPIEVVRELCSADVDGARQSLALRGVGRLNDPRHGTRSKTGEKPTNPAGATDPNRSMTRIRLDLGGGLRGEIVVAPRRARVQWTRLGSARASRTRKLTFAHRASLPDGICRAVERWTRHA